MKKLMSVLIALLVLTLAFGVAGCEPVDDIHSSSSSSSSSSPIEPEVQLSVALNESALTLDRYEEGLLIATVTDSEGNEISEQVIWESDNLSVVTVENGFVEATGVGSATITASVGDASAACVVTVEDTGALPVLKLSEESVELIIGGSCDVSASLTYKRNPIESATITYEILDTTVATVDENGNVEALKFGTTVLRVVADWKGIDPAYLTQEIEVIVREDVVVEIEQTEAVEIYTSNLELDGHQFVNSATLTANILLGGSAEGVDASKINWASSDEKVLTVANGVITAVGEGEANVTVSYTTDAQTYTSTALQVTVLFPVVEKNVKVYLDATKTVGEQISANEIFGGSESIARIFEVGYGEDLSASATWLKEQDFGTEQERTHKLVVANAEYGYAINAVVVTKIITTAAELASLQSYVTVEGGETYYSYGGYFMLGGNIIATGEEAPFSAPSMGSLDSIAKATDAAGFHGIFDGQGYTVKGFKFDIGGIFGDIGKGAVIKNVAFEDCNAAWRNFTANEGEYLRQDGVGVLAANAAGNYLIENVYVELTGNCANGGALVGRSMKGGTVRNTVVIYNATGGWNMGVLTSWHMASIKLENVYAIMQGKTTMLVGTEAKDPIAYADGSTYTVVKADEDAKAIEYKNLPSDIWFVEAGIVPVFNSMVKELVLDQTEVSVDENGEVKLTASLKDIAGGVITNKASWTSSNEAVATVENGVLTIVGIGNTTITAQFGCYSATCEVEITEAKLPVEDKTSVRLTLEAKSESSLAEQLMAEGVKAGLFESFEVASITDASGVEVADNFIANADANNTREVTLIIYAADKGYKVNAFIITKYISTAEELASLQSYSVVTEGTNAGGAKYYSYGGYFVLTNNIIATSEDATFKAPSMGCINSGAHATELAGFHGTFDGQGYVIKGIKIDIGGVFGDIGEGAVIKNVAFEDCDAAWRNFTATTDEYARQDGVGVLAANAAGNYLIENVYVELTGNCAQGGALIGRSMKGGTVKNSIIIYNGTGGWNYGALSSWCIAAVKVENVYIIMQGKTSVIFHTSLDFASGSSYKVVKADEDAAAIEYTGLSSDTWFVAPGIIPVFNSMVKELVLDQTEISVDENGEVELTASLKDIAGGVITNQASWTSSNQEIATVENGKLTILGIGNVTITAQYGHYSATCEVEITEAEIVVEDKTSVKLTLEAKNEKGLAEQLMAEGVKAGLFESFEIVSITDANGEAIAENFMATADANNTREVTLILYAADKGYKVNALIITKYISTAAELASLQSYSVVTEGTNAGGAKYYSYGGYFVLTNNIIATSEDATFKAPSMGSIGSAGHANELAGFHGTFDGQGYVVKGFKIDIGGIFGDIGDGAVIKNVAFEDCNAAWRNFTAAADGYARQDGVGVLAANAAGNWLIENVYLEATGNGANAGGLFGRSTKGGTIRNSVVIYNATGGWNMGVISSWRVADTKAENVYVIMQGKTSRIFGNGDGDTFASGSTFTVVKANEDATAVRYTGLSSDIWFAEPGMIPVFKTVVKELVLDQTSVSVDTNGEVKLNASLLDLSGIVISTNASWTSSNEAIATVSNGLLNLLAAGTVTITAEIGGYRATCEVEIAEAEFIVVDATNATLYLETANEASLAEQVVASGVKAGLFASFEAVSVTDVNGEALAEDFIAAADASNNREATLIVSSAIKGYKVKVLVVTKAISTVAELASLQSYTEVTTGTNAGGATYYSYGGYFVLANNIIATGEEAPLKAPSMGSIGSGGHATDLAGFHGTFDGQGYTVKGIKIDIGGIFGDIGKDAVIKNVAFEDCNVAWRNFTATTDEYARQDGVGVLAANAAGNWLVENVYLEATGNGANAGGLFGRSTKDGTIRNSVVIYNATGGWSMGVISSWAISNTKAENVYVIMQGKTSRIFGNSDTATFASGSTFTVVKASEDATAIEYTGLSEEYWDVTAGKIATFKAKN